MPTVEIYLLRHADAGDPEAWTGPDDERPLTERGRAQSERLGRFLSGTGWRPDRVVSSPKARARQTAEIVGDALGADATLDERLGDALSVETLSELLGDTDRRVLLVGHDPDFSEVAAELVGVDELPLKKGALVRIDTGRPLRTGRGRLRWLVPPDLLGE